LILVLQHLETGAFNPRAMQLKQSFPIKVWNSTLCNYKYKIENLPQAKIKTIYCESLIPYDQLMEVILQVFEVKI